MRCKKCGATEIEFNFMKGKIYCKICGYLIEENISNPEINFQKKENGKKEIRGQLIQKPEELKIQKRNSETLLKFGIRRKMIQLGNQLRICNEYIESAFQLFAFSLQNKFKNGKKLYSQSISCLYAVCRKEKTPHLLIDFSDVSQTRASKIGIEFLRFLKITRIPLPVIDPSVYIHRFVAKLNLGEKTAKVTMTALRLIARMKRNWISTGRKPTGLCGAAIILSTRLHGVVISQKKISETVRIGIQALKTRLFEVKHTQIQNLDIKRLDEGGGDDGNKESLLDTQIEKKIPSLFEKRSKNNFNFALEKSKENYFAVPIHGKNKTGKNLKNMEEKNLKQFKMKRKQMDVSRFLMYYINSEFETLIKEQIWEKTNADFTNFQAIKSRIQKEKPYAFFANKKIAYTKSKSNFTT